MEKYSGIPRQAAEGLLITPENAEELGKKLADALKAAAPVAGVQISKLGGPGHYSLMFHVSLDKKEDWTNGIFENSRYFKGMLDSDGTLEVFSAGFYGRPSKETRMKFLRKRKVKDLDKAIDVLKKYVKALLAAAPKPE